MRPRLDTAAKLRQKGRQAPLKRLYSVSEAATYLGRTACAVRELIWKGQLPAVKCGRRIHLDIQDLEAFVEQHKVREVF